MNATGAEAVEVPLGDLIDRRADFVDPRLPSVGRKLGEGLLAKALGASATPAPVKLAMTAMAKLMTGTAYYF